MDLNALKPKTGEIMVGADLTFAMPEPTLAQTGALLKVLTDLEIEKLVTPFAALVKSAGDGAFIDRVTSIGGDLIAAAKPVLGKQLEPAFMEAALACLDTRSFWARCRTAGLIDDEDPMVDDDGAYVSSRAVRRMVKERLTTRQAMHIVLTGWELAGVVGEVGKLLAAIFPAQETPPMKGSKKKS